MKAQIRPNRLDISDRFPLASFTIRTDGQPRVAEIVIATDPDLFTSKDGRSRSTFYSSREQGVLSLPRAEAVYTLPPEILARFSDADKLWFALATAPAHNGDRNWSVDAMPTGSSPYISLSGLTDSSLRRVRMFPRRTAQSGFGNGTEVRLEWAGDAAQPGMSETGRQAPQPAGGGNGTGAGTSSSGPPQAANGDVAYDDGFGPLPPLQPGRADEPAAEGQSYGKTTQPISDAEADRLDDQGIDGPVPDVQPSPRPAAMEGRPRALRAAEYSGVTRIMPSPAYNSGRRGQSIDRIAIHITDAPQSRWIGSWFTREEANSSAHYMVDQNGDIIQFVREQDTAWHAGNRTANRRSIGIEHVAIKEGGARYGSTTHPHTPPSDAEYRASAALVAHLCRKHGLTPDRTTIVGHNEINPGTSHSSCPSGAWDWDKYMPMVDAAHAALGGAGGGAPSASHQLGILDPILGPNMVEVATDAARDHRIESGHYEIPDERRSVEAPDVHRLSQAQRIAVQAALTAASPLLGAGRLVANANGLSLAVGVGGSIGAEAGGALGGGVIFAPDGEIGLYGLTELDIGEIFSGSVTLQVTVLQGGISAFDGIAQVATVSGGEGYVAGLTAIFDQRGRFVGVTFEGGIGFGSPFSVYYGVQRSFSTAVAQALTYVPVQPLNLDDVQVSGERQSVPAPEVDEFSQLRSIAIQALLASNPALLGFVVGARAAAEIADISIGIGPQVNAGLLGGGGLGAGLIFAPGNVMGAYGGAEVNAGFVASIGATIQLTVLRGGIESFRGISRAAAISGGEGITGGAAVIFDASNDFLGVSLQVGLGASLTPVEIYQSVQRSVATQLGVAMAFASESEAVAAGLGAGNEQVEIKYRMFIPSPIINGLPIIGDFGGDGRGFSYSSGTSRGEMSAMVEVTPGGGIASLRTTRRHWEPSSAYDRDDTRSVSGKPDWWKEKKHSGARPTRSEGLAVSDSNMRIYRGAPGTFRSVFSTTSSSSPVTMMASGNNVLVPGSPNIDADVTLYFRRNSSGRVEVKAIGSHDGFPAHEIYVNGQRIHHYDPVAHNNSPTALFPPSERDVDTPWRTVPARTSAGQSYEARAFADEIPCDPGTGGMSSQSVTAALGAGPSRTINWDEVEVVPQPTDRSCWAAAGAMLDGWKRRISIAPETVAEFAGRTTESYLYANQFEDFARDVGFEWDYGQSYTPEGFFGRLESVGPLFILKNDPSLMHCVVVTGMYELGGQWFVRIADPWDRVVGSPGSPGQYQSTHSTGSRYIMRYEDFVAEYEQAAGSGAIQVLHSGGTEGRVPNRGPKTPQGYAQSAEEPLTAKPANGAAPTLNGAAVADHAFGPQVTVTRQQVDKGKRHYDLPQLRGFVQPQTGTMAEADAMRAEPVLVDDWPYIDGPSGRTQAGVAIDWAHKGGAVGQIGITPLDGQSPNGWDVSVRADFEPGAETAGKAQVKVRLTTTFTKQGEPEQVALSEITLNGDGRSDVKHGIGETGAANGAARPEPAAQEPAPQPPAEPQPVQA